MGCDVVIAKTQSGSPPPLTGEGWGGGRTKIIPRELNSSRWTPMKIPES